MSGPIPDARQQRAEVLAAGDVAADAVGQLARPVPADGARQVALLVGGRVDVDLDEADGRVGRGAPGPSRRRRGRRRWRIRDGSWRSILPVLVVGWRGRAARRTALGAGVAARGEGQSPDDGRSRRLNSASRSVHDGGLALRLADDPRVDPARVLDRRGSGRTGRPRRRSRSCCGSRPSSWPGAGARRRRRPATREQPVEIARVEPVDDVGEADGRPRSRRATRSMTRTAVNGSPASAIVGGVIDGSGRPAGAGRSGPRPMVASGERASSRGRSSPSGSLGIAKSTTGPRGRQGPTSTPGHVSNEPSPSRYRFSDRCVMLAVPGRASGDGRAVRPV